MEFNYKLSPISESMDFASNQGRHFTFSSYLHIHFIKSTKSKSTPTSIDLHNNSLKKKKKKTPQNIKIKQNQQNKYKIEWRIHLK